jgi:hypothetical protein
VKPSENPAVPYSGSVIRCPVAAFGSVQFPAEMFAALRRQPGPDLGRPFPNNFLKHADEQTVASLAAVLQAVEKFGLTQNDFQDWGVVAAPAFLGRATLVTALQRYADEGAWGLSPHFIPHSSQHAVAGTISQALKIHGPNFGTGGSPAGVPEALLAGAVLLEGDRLPGVWVVVSGWEPEFVPDEHGTPTTACLCQAIALALVPGARDMQEIELRISPVAQSVANGSANGFCHAPAPAFAVLQQALTGFQTGAATLRWVLNSAMAVELEIGAKDSQAAETHLGHGPVGRVGKRKQAGASMENHQ